MKGQWQGAAGVTRPLFAVLRLTVLLWLCAWLATAALAAPLATRPDSPAQPITAAVAQQWYTLQHPPPLSARAFLLYDLNAGQTLYQELADQALPPASLTKLMTALLVLEANQLDETVVVQGSDLVGGSTMGLQAGERLTVAELLHGLLIPSGNDAAMALARHLSGSVAAFVTQMNERSEQLGLTQTHFVNPHGLDAPEHLSSARDLLTITRQVLIYPLAQEIVASSEATVAGHSLRNTNELLLTDPAVDGVKTGTSAAAGQCLIVSMGHEGQRVLIVLLGSQDRYADARALFQHYRAHYQWVIGNPNQLGLLNRLYDRAGTLWYLRAVGPPPALLLHPWQADQLTSFRHLRLPPAEQSWQAGLEVGELEWRFGATIIGRQALVLW